MGNRRIYSKPPILEALCELRFEPGTPWDWTVPGLFFAEVRDDFPEKAQQNVLELTMAAQGEVIAPTVKGGVARMQLLSPDRTRLIGIGPDLLSVHVLRPYPGWGSFKALVERALGVYRDIAAPKAVLRIGVRYINRVEIPTDPVELSDFFVAPPRIPEPLPQVMRSFLSRIEVVYDETTTILETLASAPAARPGELVAMLDLDVIHDAGGTPLALDDALEKIETLRAIERDCFEALITDETRGLFDE